jgi:hypothetical protein
MSTFIQAALKHEADLAAAQEQAEQKQAEQARLDFRERYRQTLENVVRPQFAAMRKQMYEHDYDGKIDEGNDGWNDFIRLTFVPDKNRLAAPAGRDACTLTLTAIDSSCLLEWESAFDRHENNGAGKEGGTIACTQLTPERLEQLLATFFEKSFEARRRRRAAQPVNPAVPAIRESA